MKMEIFHLRIYYFTPFKIPIYCSRKEYSPIPIFKITAVLMEYPGFAIFPIPASIRRRLPRLYSSHRPVSQGAESSKDPRNGLTSSSDSNLSCHSQLSPVSVDVQRPSTASEDSDFDSGSWRSDSPEEIKPPTKYETESGLRWNRVVPGESL